MGSPSVPRLPPPSSLPPLKTLPSPWKLCSHWCDYWDFPTRPGRSDGRRPASPPQVISTSKAGCRCAALPFVCPRSLVTGGRDASEGPEGPEGPEGLQHSRALNRADGRARRPALVGLALVQDARLLESALHALRTASRFAPPRPAPPCSTTPMAAVKRKPPFPLLLPGWVAR